MLHENFSNFFFFVFLLDYFENSKELFSIYFVKQNLIYFHLPKTTPKVEIIVFLLSKK